MIKRKPTHRRRPLPPTLESIEPRLLFTAAPTTTALTVSAPFVSETQSVTLTATVSAGDPLSATPTGTIAFLDLGNSPEGEDRVYFRDPSTGIYSLAHLLGSAPLAADGTATFVTPPEPFTTHNLRAVYLGATTTLFPTTVDGLHAYPPSTSGTSFQMAYGGGVYPEGYSSAVFYPSDLPFVINLRQLTFLSSLPSDVTPTDPAGTFTQESHKYSYYNSQPVYFSPDTQPLRIDVSHDYYANNRVYGDTVYTALSYTLTPVTPDPVLPGADNPAFQTSFSTSATLADDQPTTLHISASGPFTYTNPPAITVSLSTPARTSYSRHAPDPTPRGDYNKAHADLDLQVSTSPPTNGAAGSGEVNYDGSAPPFVPAGPFPTGTVSFFDEHNTLLATLPLDADGNATFYPDPRSFSLGSPHTIHAVYSGDAVYQPADAALGPFTLTHTPTRVYLQSLPSAIYSNSTLHLQGVVSTADRDTITPTGTLTFSVDGHTLTTLPALPGAPSTSDPATNPIPLTLSPGDHTIILSYSGDADCLPSSNSTTVTILPPVYTPPVYTPFELGHFNDATVTSIHYGSTTFAPGRIVDVDVSADFTGAGSPMYPNPLFAFALSADDIAGNTDDIPLSANPNYVYAALASLGFDGHAHYSNSFAVTLPAGLRLGSYHLVATVDPNNTIAENDETNNTLLSDTFTVQDSSTLPPFVDGYHTATPPVVLPYPPVIVNTPADIRGQITPVRPTAYPGTTATLTLTLTNRRKKAIHRNYKIYYYFSTDRTLSLDDTWFSKQVIHASLTKKQTRSYTLQYKLPTSAPLGTHYLIAAADTPNHAPAARLVLASKKPLQIAAPHLSAKVASTNSLGHRTRLTLRLTNTGPTPFTGPVKLRLTSTSDTNPLLRTLRRTLSLAPHASTTLTLTLPTRLVADPSALSLALL